MMKIPNDQTPENHLNGDGYSSDDYEQLEMMPAPIRDGDFSEYMWMENEEEFNSQVLRELEEEELMEECMAAMLNEPSPSETPESSNTGNNYANGSRTSNDNLNSSINGLSESVDILSLSSNGVRNNSSDNHSQNTPNSSSYRAQSRLERVRVTSPESSRNYSNSSAVENGSKSTLNPDAKEFVPVPRTVNPDNTVPS